MTNDRKCSAIETKWKNLEFLILAVKRSLLLKDGRETIDFLRNFGSCLIRGLRKFDLRIFWYSIWSSSHFLNVYCPFLTKVLLYSIGRFWNCSIYWVKNIFNKMFQKWTQNPQNLVNNEHSHPLNNPSKVTWIGSKIPVQSYAWKIARSLKSWITHYRKLSSIYSELSIKKYII